LEDIATLRPTVFISVPRLYNRIHDRIMTGVSNASPIVRKLFNTALKTKIENYESKGILTHTVWDALLFRKIRNLLGGRLRLMVSASAPISASVMQFLHVVFACPVLEGYGQTESVGSITNRTLGDREPGQVGPPASWYVSRQNKVSCFTSSIFLLFIFFFFVAFITNTVYYPICFVGHSCYEIKAVN
jgi:long-chain acyl-CoA synthetase